MSQGPRFMILGGLGANFHVFSLPWRQAFNSMDFHGCHRAPPDLGTILILVGGNVVAFGLDSKTIKAGTCASYSSETQISDAMDM